MTAVRNCSEISRIRALITIRRRRFRLLVELAIVAAACANAWQADHLLRSIKPRQEDDLVIWEKRLSPIRDALIKSAYSGADIGYIPARALKGQQRTIEDDLHWVQVRYVLIPWNVLQDSLAPHYVIADFTGGEFPPDVPHGFAKRYDSGDGLMLLERASWQ